MWLLKWPLVVLYECAFNGPTVKTTESGVEKKIGKKKRDIMGKRKKFPRGGTEGRAFENYSDMKLIARRVASKEPI